jgi:hypothetical protein
MIPCPHCKFLLSRESTHCQFCMAPLAAPVPQMSHVGAPPPPPGATGLSAPPDATTGALSPAGVPMAAMAPPPPLPGEHAPASWGLPEWAIPQAPQTPRHGPDAPMSAGRMAAWAIGGLLLVGGLALGGFTLLDGPDSTTVAATTSAPQAETASSAPPADTWADYRPADGSFTVTAPGKPMVSKYPIPDMPGVVQDHYVFESAGGSSGILVAIIHVPSGYDASSWVASTMKALPTQGYAITGQAPSKVGGVTSRSFTGTTQNQGQSIPVRGQVFVKKRIAYLIIGNTDPADPITSAVYERFLASFHPA